MAADLSFVVYTVPIPQPRPRAFVVAGHARVHGDKQHPVNAYKQQVRLMAQAVNGTRPLAGPLRVELLFTMPRPRSMVWKKRPMPGAWHQGRPDSDNLAKAVLDACQGVLWKDDSQIADLRVAKRIAAGNEQPAVGVYVAMLAG